MTWRIGLVLLLALILRVIGITWGLPSERSHRAFHPDEEYDLQCVAQIHPAVGDLNPEGSHIEGALNFYLWWAVIFPTFEIAAVEHDFTKDEARRLSILTGRIVTIVFDLCSVLLIGWLGRELTGRREAGVVAALLLAVAPGEVINSHYMRAHIMMNLWVIVAMIFAVRVSRGTLSLRGFAMFGAVIGLATATRYTLGMLAMFAAVPLFFRLRFPGAGPRPAQVTKSLIVAALCAALFFVAGDPYLFLDWDSSKQYLFHQAQHAHAEEFAPGHLFDFSNLGVYLTFLIPHALTWPVTVAFYAAFVAIAWRFRRRPDAPWYFTMLLFSAAYLYLMSKGYSVPEFVRATLPLLPVGFLFLGVLWSELMSRARPSLRIAGRCLAMGVLVAAPIRYSLAYDLVMAREDTRLQAKRWIEANVPRSEPVGLTTKPWYYTVPLYEHKYVVMPLEDLNKSAVEYWVTSDLELDPEKLVPFVEKSPYRLKIAFSCEEAPFGVNLKKGKKLPLDYMYPCLDIYVFKREWR